MSFDLPPGVLLEQITPDSHLAASSSLGFIYFQLVVLGFILFAATVAALRWSRRARSAERSYRGDAPLRPGELVVHGTVEHARNEPLAVRVEVDQRGTEAESSGSWSTSWNEVNRRVQVRPFYLRHASGQRIRVEPDHEVELVDAMDGAIRVNLAQRTRVAELTPGEQVFAHGCLFHDHDPESQEGGYRGGALGLVLRPPRGGRLLLSTEALGARFRRRAARHRRFAYGFVVLSFLADLLLIPYLASLAYGQPGRAVITDLKHIVESNSDGDAHYYRLWLQVVEPVRQTFTEDVDHGLFARLKPGMALPVRITLHGYRETRLGASATYHGAVLFFLLLPLAVLGLIYAIMATRPMAWYEGELNEGHSGRLADSKPAPPGE